MHRYSTCKHALSIPGEEEYLIECALGMVVKGSHFLQSCEPCMKYDGPDRGWGDKFHRIARPVAKALGIPGDCGGCGKRRAILNQAGPSS